VSEDYVLTVDEVRREFKARGIPVSKWAKERGFPARLVYDLLNERTKGYRGKAYAVAIELRLVRRPSASPRFGWLDVSRRTDENADACREAA